MTSCPCGSNQIYSACCGRYHAGEAAPTAEALMRSRYSAYALGNLDYIEATCCGPAAIAFDRAEAELQQLGTQWLGLDVDRTSKGRERDSQGTVSFTARYRHNGAEQQMVETSEFRRIDGRWFYYDRMPAVAAARAGTSRTGRNDPCPCGSGRKYKKCCGAAG
ncbi:YchJ family protein [uncultured Hoeflea sp.]|uniref:YchJ family protein n=1 Tax=uncultured Hoeflea sp. TaxID=538666 RepID=UPI0030EC821A|tara:strand:+ start:5252 stop:5740 length:489 start_codon:yes stop_codon:yes gene_type:complete